MGSVGGSRCWSCLFSRGSRSFFRNDFLLRDLFNFLYFLSFFGRGFLGRCSFGWCFLSRSSVRYNWFGSSNSGSFSCWGSGRCGSSRVFFGGVRSTTCQANAGNSNSTNQHNQSTFNIVHKYSKFIESLRYFAFPVGYPETKTKSVCYTMKAPQRFMAPILL